MSTWIAAAIAVAAVAATYFSCVRPMLRGRCASSGTLGQNAEAQNAEISNQETDRQVAELREELRMLRAQDALDSGRVSNTKMSPPSTSE